MPRAHLLHGYLGAGKTTLAKQLEQDRNAVRFTHDEWMARLYGVDPPAAHFTASARRVADLMQPVWTRCLRLGTAVVLDFGFWTRAERDHVRALVRAHGGEPILHHLHCSDAVALARIEQRNRRLDGSLFIALDTYRTLRTRFEPLAPDEERIDHACG